MNKSGNLFLFVVSKTLYLAQELAIIRFESWDRDWENGNTYLKVKTETKTFSIPVSMSEIKIFFGNGLVVETETVDFETKSQIEVFKTIMDKTSVFNVVKTETFWDSKWAGILRPTLFETMGNNSCWDWDQAVLVKSCPDWAFSESFSNFIFSTFCLLDDS